MTRIYADSTCEHGRYWTTCRLCIEQEYCGCCGYGPILTMWCKQCESHVLRTGPYESRTYFAQHGKECPN